MKRLILSFVFTAAFAFAQHEAPKHEEEPGTLWKWVNFGILACALGYGIGKYAPGFFRSRTEEIQRGIAEATRMRQDADERAAAMDKRMASLESEIADLRAHAKSEIAAEATRVGVETTELLAKMQAHAEQEIAAASKSATLQLKAFTAELALDLAEAKLRGRMTPGADKELIGDFLKGLKN